MTMIELLLALGLLTAVMLAVASWIQVTGRVAATGADPLRWRIAAESALRLIHEDLTVGDFSDRQGSPTVKSAVLEIRTRARFDEGLHGPIVHRYVFDTTEHELVLEQLAPDRRVRTRVLLRQLGDWRPELLTEQGALDVVLTSNDGLDVSRRYPLP